VRRVRRNRWLLLVLFAAWGAAAAEDDTYVRGYFDALLDSRFPALGLNVRALAAREVTLGARLCLGPVKQREVERLLATTGRIDRVIWDASADCAVAAARVPAADDIEIRLLPEEELFAPLLADPRQARFSMSYQRYRAPSERFNAASVAFGEYFALATGRWGETGRSQVGIQGAVFALFNLDAPSSDLVNADYWIGLPVSFRRGPWSYVLRLYHQSSHLGDEFLLGNPGLDRVNLSYEDAMVLASYEWEFWRVYGGVGRYLRSEPDLRSAHVQAGGEYVLPGALGGFDFIAAVDTKTSAELDWSRSFSVQTGFEFGSASPRRLRLMFEYYRGQSPNGQFYREKLTYAGVGLYFRF
jgi:hypothetical protein